jgi:hypothetical protein
MDGELTIGTYDITNIGEIALSGEVANPDLRDIISLCLRDTPRERRDDKLIGLSGTYVVKGPGPHHLNSATEETLQPNDLRGNLARSIGGDRTKGSLFSEHAPLSRSIDLCGTHEQHAREGIELSDELEEFNCAKNVNSEGLLRCLPGATDVSQRGKVVDNLWSRSSDLLACGTRYGDVNGIRECQNLIAHRLQMCTEPSADEARGSGE